MRTTTRMAGTLALVLASATRAVGQHDHHHGEHPAPAETPALGAQIEAVRAATARYRDHAAAEADGYRRFGGQGPLMGEHWYHPDLTRRPLDLTRPSTLQYAVIGGRRELVGVAYTLYQRPGEPLPQGFAGADDHWHTHDVVGMAREISRDRPVLRWIVNRRAARGKMGAGEGRTRLTMVHAWVWSDNPDGVFAQEHRALPYLRAGLPAEWARGADRDAAMGVSLLMPAGCDAGEGVGRLLRLERGQRAALETACGAAAGRVRGALGSGPDSLNRAAAEAWRAYDRERRRVLTPAQRERIRALEETTMHH